MIAADGVRREHELKSSVVYAAEVACAARLVLLGADGERIYIDSGVRSSRVVLEGLHGVEVRPFAL